MEDLRHDPHGGGKVFASPEKPELRTKKKLQPMPVAPAYALQTVEEQAQLFGPQQTTDAFAVGPAEASAIQAFGTDPQTRTVIAKNFQPVAVFVGENKKVARCRILL